MGSSLAIQSKFANYARTMYKLAMRQLQRLNRSPMGYSKSWLEENEKDFELSENTKEIK